MGEESRIRVLVADSQRLFAESLADAIRSRSALDVLHDHPTTGLAVVEAAQASRPGVVLVDYWMAGMDGPAVTQALLAAAPDRKVLHLAWFHGPPHVHRAIDAGAVGFLPKSVTVAHVVEAIRLAASGRSLVYGPELASLMENVDRKAEEANRQWERLLTLTPREVEVLQLLNQGLSTSDIARTLAISVGTVKNHIHKLLRKTDTRTQLEAIALARRHRLIWDVAPRPERRAGPHFST